MFVNEISLKVVEMYTAGDGINKISRNLNISQKKIYQILNDNDISIRNKGGKTKNLSFEEVKEIVKMYENKTPLSEIGKIFKTSKERIKEILTSNGIELRTYSTKKEYSKGSKFHKLTLLDESTERRNKKIVWIMKCECGKVVDVLKPDVLSGKTKSCGCLKNTPRRNNNRKEILINTIFSEYKKSAYTRGYVFLLTLSEFEKLIFSKCFYCSTDKSSSRIDKLTGFTLQYMGIDRINNEKGYTSENVVPCCYTCNRMKSSLNGDEFLKIIENIYKNRFANHADNMIW